MLDDDGAASLREALRTLRCAGDLVERVAYPGDATRSPLGDDLSDALFRALAGIVDGERNLSRALRLIGEDPAET